MKEKLYVFREIKGVYQHVGALSSAEEGVVFGYDPEYLTSDSPHCISLDLPLQQECFTPKRTRVFFEGLLPEGEMRELFARLIRIEADDYIKLLSILNNETAGALVFSKDREGPSQIRSYKPFTMENLKEFSRRPRSVALSVGMESRLSIAGAQTKLGLYHEGSNPLAGWFVPEGIAPSNAIIKCSDGLFPLQTINEGLCLTTAHHCELERGQCFFIPMDEGEPLLAVKRFDRIITSESPVVNGHRLPTRLHQEDLCQAAGILSYLKYEPTDGNYLNLVAFLIARHSENPLEDRVTFFKRILFDYVIGNCDNHLKNHSFLWKNDWSTCKLSPLYDITCTTMYPNLAREMGVSLCQSRRIDDVTKNDILVAAKKVGISERLGKVICAELAERFPSALRKAENEIAQQGIEQVSEVADLIADAAKIRMQAFG